MIWASLSQYSAASNGRITASDFEGILGNQVYPVVQMLLPNNDTVFRDDISSIHTHPEVLNQATEPTGNGTNTVMCTSGRKYSF